MGTQKNHLNETVLLSTKNKYYFLMGKKIFTILRSKIWLTEPKLFLSLTMLNIDTFFFENSVDPNQLVSQKPADQNPHCFPLCLQINVNDGSLSC